MKGVNRRSPGELAPVRNTLIMQAVSYVESGVMVDEIDREIAASLRIRDERLKWLKQRIFDLEYAGRYRDARRVRELLALATEAIGLARIRLARSAWCLAEAERVRQKAEAMHGHPTQKDLLATVHYYEQTAQALKWVET